MLAATVDTKRKTDVELRLTVATLESMIVSGDCADHRGTPAVETASRPLGEQFVRSANRWTWLSISVQTRTSYVPESIGRVPAGGVENRTLVEPRRGSEGTEKATTPVA